LKQDNVILIWELKIFVLLGWINEYPLKDYSKFPLLLSFMTLLCLRLVNLKKGAEPNFIIWPNLKLNRKEEIILADLFVLKLLLPDSTKRIFSSYCFNSRGHSMSKWAPFVSTLLNEKEVIISCCICSVSVQIFCCFISFANWGSDE
jgi:hypothetical protein